MSHIWVYFQWLGWWGVYRCVTSTQPTWTDGTRGLWHRHWRQLTSTLIGWQGTGMTSFAGLMLMSKFDLDLVSVGNSLLSVRFWMSLLSWHPYWNFTLKTELKFYNQENNRLVSYTGAHSFNTADYKIFEALALYVFDWNTYVVFFSHWLLCNIADTQYVVLHSICLMVQIDIRCCFVHTWCYLI